jgi:transcription antitermination factor NusG
VTESGEALPRMQNWLVIRTRPRWEKKVTQLLAAKGIEIFCPLVKERHQWTDRIKTIDLPLLKSHLFVRINEEQRTAVRLTEGVVNFMYKAGKPVIIREKLMQQIREFQELHSPITAVEPRQLTAVQNGADKLLNGNGKTSHLFIEPLDIVLVGYPCSGSGTEVKTVN